MSDVVFQDTVIYETETFKLSCPIHPHIPRADGGHLYIRSKEKYFSDRTDFSPREAIEAMRLSVMAGEAMTAAMKQRGVDIARINYQENGNWAFQTGSRPAFHIHLYGRTVNSKTQTWSEALVFPNRKTGFYEGFDPFTADDLAAIREEMDRLASTPRFAPSAWGL